MQTANVDRQTTPDNAQSSLTILQEDFRRHWTPYYIKKEIDYFIKISEATNWFYIQM